MKGNGDVIQSLNRRTTADSVAGILRQQIREGTLAAGTRLRQSEVAKRLGVSTTPVREAFALLQADGLVQVDRHRGAVVYEPSVEDLREFYEIREALEALAISLALPHLTDQHLDQLEALIAEMRTCKDDQRWLELNDLFHISLYEASGRKRLCSIISGLRDSSRVYIHMFVAHGAKGERADDEHAAILNACRSRDRIAAMEAVKSHLQVAVRKDTEILEGPSTTEQKGA